VGGWGLAPKPQSPKDFENNITYKKLIKLNEYSILINKLKHNLLLLNTTQLYPKLVHIICFKKIYIFIKNFY
jgi:hypothetical protein